MKILTSTEMRETDRRTAEEFDVSLEHLMERAGGAVARFCGEVYPGARRVAVVCGRGNNGGDGLVAARHLTQAGCEVRVLLLAGSAELQGEAAGAMVRLRTETPAVEVREVGSDVTGEELKELLGWAELVVDAVVGTGFKPPLRGAAVAIKDALLPIGTPVVAVDLPSGWDADATTQHPEEGDAFRADAVVTFTAPKMAHVFGHLTPGRTFGPVVVAGIGSPAEAVESEQRLWWTGASKRVVEQGTRCELEQGKVRARAAGGRELWEGGSAVDGVAGGAADGRGAGDGGGTGECAEHGGADYAGVDDAAAGAGRGGSGFPGEPGREAIGEADQGHDGAGDRAGAFDGRGGECVCAGAGGDDDGAGGDRRGCAECVCGEG